VCLIGKSKSEYRDAVMNVSAAADLVCRRHLIAESRVRS
jgi:hypothetical protein